MFLELHIITNVLPHHILSNIFVDNKRSGSSIDRSSGHVAIETPRSGMRGNSGSLSLNTGSATGYTGESSSGNITLSTGAGSAGFAGNINLLVGESRKADGGNISVIAGSSSDLKTTGGVVTIKGGLGAQKYS